MKQVIQSPRTGKLGLKEVPAPSAGPGQLLVATRASLISAGTERMVVEFAGKSLAGKARARPDLLAKTLRKARRDGVGATMRAVLARLDEPLPLGYSAAGAVAAVGDGLEGAFRIGERVAVAGAGIANHAELNVVPRALAAPIPDRVTDDEACFATLAAIALHGVRNLGVGLGDVVCVIGAGLVGQLAAQLLTLAGARAIVVDYDAARLKTALAAGAEATWNLADAGLAEEIAARTQARGCDGVLIAAATRSSEPFATAAAVARDRARICVVGMTGTQFPYREFMAKELSVVVSRSYGPGRYDAGFEGRGVKYPVGFVRWTETENLAECVRLMSPEHARRLDVGPLISHRFAIDDAEAAYAVVAGGEAHLGVVLGYPPRAPEQPRPAPAAQAQVRAAHEKGVCAVALIGAGNFARGVLIPELVKLEGVRLETVVTRRGAGAEAARETFGFADADTDPETVFASPRINAVIIATRHDSHAALTGRALRAGKAVLVEKPLGLDRAEIEGVRAASAESQAFFQVGFNRRFAPLAREMRGHLERLSGPKFLLLRVNAGPVPNASWIDDAHEGGGRILGEVCHFVDLARYLTGAAILSVGAEAARSSANACADVNVSLGFADGSLATIVYTALGDASRDKELIEAYGGGSVARIEDFRTLAITEGGRVKTRKSRRAPDKGIRAELSAFVDAVAGGGPAPIAESELVETSLATVAVMESLRTGARVAL